ncbi:MULTISPECIES: MarR family winged helix-turn-helix transcriptional regulator [unclassified Methanoculleus]|jgi:DNA-binding MarR family transcriptional regulator|uniref:MarR family winged helix-turn-helix transcriptional regulator n=1 Tax=unclassified Methanoculleus TaxID=2619537 RepID=UPI0025FCD528|nr:MarR family winged helix-turn-helix transcriptional regulator [Methanoculleus sp. UBA377]
MEQAVVEKFLNEIPYEARVAVMELNNDLRWAVYIALVLEGRKYFSEIKEEFKANPNTIGPVLKGLVDGGLVARKIAKFEDFVDKRKVFYEPTDIGLRLFEVLNDVAIPEGRAPRELRVGGMAGSTIGIGARKYTGIRREYVGQPNELVLRGASKSYKPWKATRERRGRASWRSRAKQPGLV